MDNKKFSVNFSKDITTYTNESSFPIDNVDVGHSLNILQTSFNTQPSELPVDYVKSSTGGIFFGKLEYGITINNFSNNEIPTASWVLSKITNSSGGIDEQVFEVLFNNKFYTKSISDLSQKDHSMLTNISGNGQIHLSTLEYSNIKEPASDLTNGYLRKEDYSIFKNKQDKLVVGTGLSLVNNTLNLVLSNINHDALKNYDLTRHYKCDDSITSSTTLWSSNKITNYISSIISPPVTDYVSKLNGGQFSSKISYTTNPNISSDLDIVHKEYVDNSILTSIDSVYTTLKGTENNSVKTILGTLSLSDLGTRNHSNLTNILGDSEEEAYHLTLVQFNRVKNKASENEDGYLSKEDWILFNSKLGEFSTVKDLLQEEFIRYSNGIMYYNPTKINHDDLLNYSPERHPLLNDEEVTDTNVWSASKIMSMLTGSDFQSYRINLNSGATVAQRLIGLVEGQDYPTGWELSADGSSLIITHNLNNLVSVISVYSVNGITNDAVKLEGNVAYSTLTNIYYNNGYNRIKLDTFATITTNLIIKIIL